MIILVEDIEYKADYFPFFEIESYDDHPVYEIRYPSGDIDEVLIFDKTKSSEELSAHAKFLIKEFALEADEMLTPEAKKLKQNVRELFKRRSNH